MSFSEIYKAGYEMKIMLTVPVYEDNLDWQKWYDDIQELIYKSSVDLVVFPECFRSPLNGKEQNNEVKSFAIDFNVPVLMGIGGSDGSQWAVYYNPKPKADDTNEKIYCKHSTADVTAFDYDNYSASAEEYFKPILLNGAKIQVNVCHDIFFPLITEKMEREGMDVLINLTGGNVNLNKWHTVFKGRSLETKNPILCSMAFNPEHTGKSEAFMFMDGNKVKPNIQKGNAMKNKPEMLIFDLDNVQYDEDYFLNSSESDKKYKDFTISFDNDADADIRLVVDGGQFNQYRKVSSKTSVIQNELTFKLKEGNLTVHFLPFSKLKCRDAIKNLNFENGSKYFIVAYYSLENVDEHQSISLLKLRAIENRIGCILVSPNLKIGLKTNRYKNIQLFYPDKNNLIGFDLNFIEGIESVFNKSNSFLGIKKVHSNKYMNLLD
jgi:predicted amidohydrolase